MIDLHMNFNTFSEILNGTVDSVNVRTDKHHITVNCLNGNAKLHVFITELKDGGSDIADYVLADDLVSFIRENTN